MRLLKDSGKEWHSFHSTIFVKFFVIPALRARNIRKLLNPTPKVGHEYIN